MSDSGLPTSPPRREQQIVSRTATLWIIRTPLGNVRTYRHTLQTASEHPLSYAEETIDVLCREIIEANDSDQTSARRKP